MSTLWTSYPALICRRAEGIIRSVNHRAAWQQRVGHGRAAVISQRGNLGSIVNQIARHRVATAILDQVIAAGSQSDGTGCMPLTGIPLVAGDNRIGEL